MTTDEHRSLSRAILTKAADCEASRQRAVRDGDQARVAAAEEARRQDARARGDRAAEQQHEAELQKLWHAWATRPIK
jgi:hypothetical protein